MLRMLDKGEKEQWQGKGYMCEHLLCLYSMIAEKTYLYNDNYPVFVNGYGEADVILFGFKGEGDVAECLSEVTNLPVDDLNLVSPKDLGDIINVETMGVEWDYQIRVRDFDFDMNGGEYKNIRYHLKNAEKMGLQAKISRDFTKNHVYVLSRHMATHRMDVWDYEELLSLNRFFDEHDHGFMLEAYKQDRLVGFDVIDFFEDNGVIVVPLGVYLRHSSLSDFMMYENLKLAREKGCVWLDVGSDCGLPGLRSFKEKWMAKPRYKIYVQKLRLT